MRTDKTIGFLESYNNRPKLEAKLEIKGSNVYYGMFTIGHVHKKSSGGYRFWTNMERTIPTLYGESVEDIEKQLKEILR